MALFMFCPTPRSLADRVIANFDQCPTFGYDFSLSSLCLETHEHRDASLAYRRNEVV